MNKSNGLIIELYKLINKYSVEDWRALHTLLSNEDLRTIIAKITPEIQSIKRLNQPLKSKAEPKIPKVTVPDFLSIPDSEKRQLLIVFRTALRTKELSPALSDLRQLAETAGMKENLATKRNQAIDQIIRILVNNDIDNINRVIETSDMSKLDLGDEYSRWVDHILGRQSREQKESDRGPISKLDTASALNGDSHHQ